LCQTDILPKTIRDAANTDAKYEPVSR